jgi:hypothetical protein
MQLRGELSARYLLSVCVCACARALQGLCVGCEVVDGLHSLFSCASGLCALRAHIRGRQLDKLREPYFIYEVKRTVATLLTERTQPVLPVADTRNYCLFGNPLVYVSFS